MKCVFFGYDMMLGAVQSLINQGHVFTHIFSFPCDNMQMSNAKIKAFAQEQGITYTENQVNPEAIDVCIQEGAELFISAGYPYKIPPISTPAKGINFHPTLLPEGRGIIPMPYLIKENPKAAGMTIHKLSDKFDHGDILIQKPFDLSPQEDIETLMARIVVHGPGFLVQAIENLHSLWDRATPQKGEGSHYKNPTDEMRILDFTKSVSELNALKRAFGKIGTLFHFQGQILIILDFAVWEEEHSYTPGEIVAELINETVIAAKDGFVVIKNAVLTE